MLIGKAWCGAHRFNRLHNVQLSLQSMLGAGRVNNPLPEAAAGGEKLTGGWWNVMEASYPLTLFE